MRGAGIEITDTGRSRGVELICTMTGFRSRFLIHHIGEGFFHSVALGPELGERKEVFGTMS
jgi:hypothetical protein